MNLSQRGSKSVSHEHPLGGGELLRMSVRDRDAVVNYAAEIVKQNQAMNQEFELVTQQPAAIEQKIEQPRVIVSEADITKNRTVNKFPDTPETVVSHLTGITSQVAELDDQQLRIEAALIATDAARSSGEAQL